MFDIVNFTLAADLVNNGTVTVGYPTNRTKGDYNLWSTGRHVMIAGQNVYNAPSNFTLTFNNNASNITLTNTTGSTIKAGTSISLQVERPGVTDAQALDKLVLSDQVKHINGNVYLLNLGSPNALSTNGIATSRNSSSLALASFDATGVDANLNPDGSVVLTTPRNITASWTTSAVMTVKGFDQFGQAMSEASSSGTSFTGRKAFKTITSVTFSVDVTACTVGYGDAIGLPVAVVSASEILAEIINGVRVGGAPRKVRIPWSLNQVDLLAGSTNSAQVIAPFAGTVSLVATVVRKAITTGGTLTFKNGSTTLVGATVTIADGAVQQASQFVTPTLGDSSLTVAKNALLQVVPASFATAGEVDGFIEFTPSSDTVESGTFVSADGRVATTTTKDVRGTYTPEIANGGGNNIGLIVVLANPNYIGVTQA